MFYATNSLNFKGGLITIQPFLFLLYSFIYLSEVTSKFIGIVFNFKNSIYHTSYYGIFYTMFYNAIKLIGIFLKLGINLLCNKIKPKNIYFYFYFITNQNVTSQLIARYLAQKFKKGFSLKKIIYPLKGELRRVSLRGRVKQENYNRSNYSLIEKKNKIQLKN
jgi:hypothetical protein